MEEERGKSEVGRWKAVNRYHSRAFSKCVQGQKVKE